MVPGVRHMPRPRIQVLLDDAAMTSQVRGALQRLEAEVLLAPLSPPAQSRSSEPIHARLLLTRDAGSLSDDSLGKLLEWCDTDPCATLVLSERSTRAERLKPAFNGRPIEFAAGLSGDDLAGRLSGMCLLRESLAAMRQEMQTLHHHQESLRAALRELTRQVRLAGAIQRELLPAALPPLSGADLLAFYHPAEDVGGDIYDVFRADDGRVAFFLADATGHGLPAGLLSAMMGGSMRAHHFAGASGSPAPSDVLAQLNRELISHALSECQFLAAACAVYNESTRLLRWSRGGAPYPILIRDGDPPRGVVTVGPLIGVDPGAAFETTELTLQPGDTVLFHTDGLENLLHPAGASPVGVELASSAWVRGLAGGDVAGQFEELKRLLAHRPLDKRTDDVTAIALHVRKT